MQQCLFEVTIPAYHSLQHLVFSQRNDVFMAIVFKKKKVYKFSLVDCLESIGKRVRGSRFLYDVLNNRHVVRKILFCNHTF